jgi:FkbM family methyltransferase
MGKLKCLFDYFKYLKNPFTALAFKFGLKKNCLVKFKNLNGEINLTSIVALNRLMDALNIVKNDKLNDMIKYIKEIDNDSEFVYIDNIKYYNVHNSYFKKENACDYSIHITECFSDDEWDMIDFQNRFVIDIGANVADTTLYFAKNGANVIGFEPVKHLYDLGIKNISVNPNLKNNITFINKAVGGKKGKISIEDNNSTKDYIDQNGSYDMEVITIKDVLNDYNFTPDVLKMDCEGCEFEIILNEDLTMFNDIIFEHHSEIVGKDYNLLVEKLKKENFKINTWPCNASNKSFDKIGIIHAYK